MRWSGFFINFSFLWFWNHLMKSTSYGIVWTATNCSGHFCFFHDHIIVFASLLWEFNMLSTVPEALWGLFDIANRWWFYLKVERRAFRKCCIQCVILHFRRPTQSLRRNTPGCQEDVLMTNTDGCCLYGLTFNQTKIGRRGGRGCKKGNYFVGSQKLLMYGIGKDSNRSWRYLVFFFAASLTLELAK